jgi:hypothetical protein
MYDLKYAEMTWHRGTQILKKPGRYLKILDTRMVPLGKFHTEDPPVLLPTVQTFVPLGTCCLVIFTPLRLCIIFILWLW